MGHTSVNWKSPKDAPWETLCQKKTQWINFCTTPNSSSLQQYFKTFK